jgi:hypothetical protein
MPKSTHHGVEFETAATGDVLITTHHFNGSIRFLVPKKALVAYAVEDEVARLIKICRLKDERIAAAEGEAKALARINEELQQRVDVIESPDRDALIRLSHALHLI